MGKLYAFVVVAVLGTSASYGVATYSRRDDATVQEKIKKELDLKDENDKRSAEHKKSAPASTTSAVSVSTVSVPYRYRTGLVMKPSLTPLEWAEIRLKSLENNRGWILYQKSYFDKYLLGGGYLEENWDKVQRVEAAREMFKNKKDSKGHPYPLSVAKMNETLQTLKEEEKEIKRRLEGHLNKWQRSERQIDLAIELTRKYAESLIQ